MAAARRPAPIYMFNRYADMSQLTGEPGEGWTKMECDSKKAYGCGENIQEAVKGLVLYVRLGDYPLITSSLAIRLTDEALRRFNKQFEFDIRPPHPKLSQFQLGIRPPGPELFQPEMTAWAHILMHAEEDLMIITLSFDRPFYGSLVYNLVYDHKRASLSIIKPVQVPALVLQPVPRRTCNGDYELVHMAIDCVNGFSSPQTTHFLCVFSPATAAAATAVAWEIRRVGWSVPLDVDRRFRTDLTFSFQGKGVWVDLSQGLEYCDLDTAASVVDFSYYPLPHECVLDLEKVLDMDLQEPMQATRTMGCDSDSIWFVCIHEGISDNCADNLVSMWTLKLQEGKGQWRNEVKFSLRDLWRFDGFKEAGLPEARVTYPLLNVADGVLNLVLSGEYLGPDARICWVDHMCSFDVCNKKLLWHGTVHNLPVTQPAAFPSCFFQTERVHRPAAGLALLLQPESKVVRSTTTLQPGSKVVKVVRSTTTLQPGSKQKRIITLEA